MQGSVWELCCSLSICLNIFWFRGSGCFAYGRTVINQSKIEKLAFEDQSEENSVWIIKWTTQNCRQKVFNRGLCSSVGGLCVCAVGLGIIKLPKPPLIYSVLRSNMGGLELCLERLSPTKPPWRRDWNDFAGKFYACCYNFLSCTCRCTPTVFSGV